MKTNVFVLLLLLIGVSSCTSGLRIEKRQHRPGFYIAGISHNEQRTADSGSRTVIQKDIPETAIAEEQQQVNREAPAESAQSPLIDTADAQQVSAPVEDVRSTEEKAVPVPQPEKKTAARPYEGPVDGKRLNDLFWTACIMTAVAIVVTLLVFFIPGAYPFMFLGSIGTLAVLAAIVINICVAAIAGDRSRFYEDKDPETSEFYRKLKRKALWYFAILGGAIVLYYIGIIVVMLLLM